MAVILPFAVCVLSQLIVISAQETVESILSAFDAPTDAPLIDSDLEITGPHMMGDMITCLEQNEENPYGFREKATFADPEWEGCQAENNPLGPALCARYSDAAWQRPPPVKPGQGDVCDHEDPNVYDDDGNRLTRDACSMQVSTL